LPATGAGEQSLNYDETILALKDASRERCDAGALDEQREGASDL